MYPEYRICIFGNVIIYIKLHRFPDIFHLIRRTKENKTCLRIDPFDLHSKLVDHVELLLRIMQTQNRNLAEFMFPFFLEMSNEFLTRLERYYSVT